MSEEATVAERHSIRLNVTATPVGALVIVVDGTMNTFLQRLALPLRHLNETVTGIVSATDRMGI